MSVKRKCINYRIGLFCGDCFAHLFISFRFVWYYYCHIAQRLDPVLSQNNFYLALIPLKANYLNQFRSHTNEIFKRNVYVCAHVSFSLSRDFIRLFILFYRMKCVFIVSHSHTHTYEKIQSRA